MMDDIKEMVTHVLDQRGVLARMKAELRANVFLAIDDQEKRKDSGIHAKTLSRNRQLLKQSREGRLLADLVREFLDWCDLQFTVKVYDPEMQCSSGSADRQQLAAQLGMQGLAGEQPLLLAVLNTFMTAEGGQQTASAATANAAEAVSVSPGTAPAAAAAAPASQVSSHQPAAQKVAQRDARKDEDSDDLIGVDVHIEHEEGPLEDDLSTFARTRGHAFDGADADSDVSASASPPNARHQLSQSKEPVQVTSPASRTSAAASAGVGIAMQLSGKDGSSAGAAGNPNPSPTRSDVSPSASPSSVSGQGLKPLGKLEPLAPLRGAKLGPLPALKLGAVTATTKDDPLLPQGTLSPAGRAILKSSEELKEELRMAGLICDAPPSPTAPPKAEAAIGAAGSAAGAGPGAPAKSMPPRSSALDTDSESDISTESFSEEDLELELPMGDQEGHHAEQAHLAGGHSNVFSDGDTALSKVPDGARANISLDFSESGWAANDRSGDFDHLHLASGVKAGLYHADDDSNSSSDDDF